MSPWTYFIFQSLTNQQHLWVIFSNTLLVTGFRDFTTSHFTCFLMITVLSFPVYSFVIVAAFLNFHLYEVVQPLRCCLRLLIFTLFALYSFTAFNTKEPNMVDYNLNKMQLRHCLSEPIHRLLYVHLTSSWPWIKWNYFWILGIFFGVYFNSPLIN